MVILVPGWSRAEFLVQIFVLIFILFGIFVDDILKKNGKLNVTVVKFWNILDIVNTAKTDRGSKMRFWKAGPRYPISL